MEFVRTSWGGTRELEIADFGFQLTEYTASGEQTRSVPMAMMSHLWQHVSRNFIRVQRLKYTHCLPGMAASSSRTFA